MENIQVEIYIGAIGDQSSTNNRLSLTNAWLIFRGSIAQKHASKPE